MIRFQDLIMIDGAAKKWASCPIDVRIVLNIAFSYAIQHPTLTAAYTERSITYPDVSIQLVGFRAGYATFLLMYVEGADEYVVIDFDYADDAEVHGGLHTGL